MITTTDPALKAAADWWVNTLAGSVKQNNGDGFQSMLATLVGSEMSRPSKEWLEQFREHLLEEMTLEKLEGKVSAQIGTYIWAATMVLIISFSLPPAMPLDLVTNPNTVKKNSSKTTVLHLLAPDTTSATTALKSEK